MLRFPYMRPTHPLDGILGVPSRVAVLRVLSRSKVELTGRETARQAGVSTPRAIEALEALSARGVVLRRRAGRAGLYRLNAERVVVRRGLAPLFALERQLLDEGLRRLARGLKPLRPISVVFFGSRARGDADEASDVDILVVVGDRTAVVEERIRAAAADASSSSGMRFSPLIFSAGECRRAKAGRAALLRAAADEGRLVVGRPLEAVLGA